MSEQTTTESSDTSDVKDVIVVGGGVIGVACAHYLQQQGASVTVIEQDIVGKACSYGNCGYICPSHVLPLTEPGAIKTAIKSLFTPNAPFRVKFRFSPSMWRWMWEFTRRCNRKQMLAAGVHLKTILDSSMNEYRQLMASEQFNCDWQESGLLYILQTAGGMHEFAETDKLLTDEFGVSARRLDGDELPTFDPSIKPGLAGAFHYPDDASLRPDRLSIEWSTRQRERGVKFIENCSLERIVVDNGHVKCLETSKGEMRARQYVFALGAWSPKWSKQLGCHIPIQPGKGYSVTMRRPDPCPHYPILFPEHRVGATPFSGGYRLGSMMEFVGFDTSIPHKRIMQLRRSAEPYLVSPHVEGEEETWFGWRPMTWDSLPIIGPVPGKTNAFLATGHNMLGLSLATATGKLVAEMVTGQPAHIDADAFSPERF